MQGSCIYWNSHAWNMYRSQQYYQSVMHCTCIDGNRAHKVLHKLNTYTCVVLPNCTGRYYLVDRMWDWTVGLDSEKVALILLKPHTSALQHTILTSHELNLGEMTMTWHQYHWDETQFQQPFLPVHMLHECLHWDKYWPPPMAINTPIHWSWATIITTQWKSYVYVGLPDWQGIISMGKRNHLYTVSRIYRCLVQA